MSHEVALGARMTKTRNDVIGTTLFVARSETRTTRESPVPISDPLLGGLAVTGVDGLIEILLEAGEDGADFVGLAEVGHGVGD